MPIWQRQGQGQTGTLCAPQICSAFSLWPLLSGPHLARAILHCTTHVPTPCRDYNDYVMRNLSRGYSREDLGLRCAPSCLH